MPTKALRALWKVASGEASDMSRAQLAVVRDDCGELAGMDLTAPQAVTVLRFVSQLKSAQGTLQARMDILAQEVFPPILALITTMSQELDSAEGIQDSVSTFASETKSQLAAELARQALAIRREAETVRRDNLRLLIAKAMALVQIYDAVHSMMSEQMAPINAASQELIDIRAAQAMKEAAYRDLSRARRQQLAVEVEIDAAVAERIPELAAEMQRVAASYVDILDTADVLFGGRSQSKKLGKAQPMDTAFEHLCTVHEREVAALRSIGDLTTAEVSSDEIGTAAKEVISKLRRALDKEAAPAGQLTTTISSTPNVDTGNAFSELDLQTDGEVDEDRIDTIAAKIEARRASKEEARSIIAWALTNRIFRKSTPSRIRLAQAISSNKGFKKNDIKALWQTSPSGMSQYFSNW